MVGQDEDDSKSERSETAKSIWKFDQFDADHRDCCSGYKTEKC